jgi:glycine cleavage system H protein
MTAVETPGDRWYTKSHEWVRTEGSEVVIGITDHAQSELTDIVFVDLPKVGKPLKAGEVVLVLESVKTVADVYAPVSGEVTAVNDGLRAHPDLVNRSPYQDGWLVRLRRTAPDEAVPTLTGSAYDALNSPGTTPPSH